MNEKMLEEILRSGAEHPLSDDEQKRLLLRIIARIRATALEHGDTETLTKMPEDDEQLVLRIIKNRKQLAGFYLINFSPFTTNVIDCIGRDDLVTRDGRKVAIDRSCNDFKITIGDEVHYTPDNLQASYLLNTNETGGTK